MIFAILIDFGAENPVNHADIWALNNAGWKLGKGNLHPISESGTQSLYTFLKAIKIDGSGNQLEYIQCFGRICTRC